MLEALSCIFRARPGTNASLTSLLGELPGDVSALEIPSIDPGQSALRQAGKQLVILAPAADGSIIGFVLDDVPPATQLQRIARQLARLASSGDLATGTSVPDNRPDAVLSLVSALGQAEGRVPPRRLLAMAGEALTNTGAARNAALVVCRPGQQASLTLSSVALEPARDAISDLLRRWRAETPVSERISVRDVDGENLQREDTILLMDKVGAQHCFISLPAAGQAGFGFLLFDPGAADPEHVCKGLRSILELRHKTQRDWSKRRTFIRRGAMAAAAAFLVFLLLPADRTVTTSGVTRPRDVQVVSVHFGTYLDHMAVEVGQTLAPGDPIAVLTAPDQEDAQASAMFQRSVEVAAANAALADDNYGAYVQAQSRVALQQTRLQQIEARMALLAPVAESGGRVVAALSGGEQGRYLPPGTEIARIQTGSSYSFEMTLSASDAGLVEVGQTGRLSLRGQLGRDYTIRVLTPPAPDPEVSPDEGTPVLVATALIETEGEAEVIPGLSGFARIDTGRAMRLRVWSRHIVEFVRMKAWTILNWRI